MSSCRGWAAKRWWSGSRQPIRSLIIFTSGHTGDGIAQQGELEAGDRVHAQALHTCHLTRRVRDLLDRNGAAATDHVPQMGALCAPNIAVAFERLAASLSLSARAGCHRRAAGARPPGAPPAEECPDWIKISAVSDWGVHPIAPTTFPFIKVQVILQ